MAVSYLLWLLVILSWSLEGVKSQQRFPHVSFCGQTLDNHAYVDISEVGDGYYKWKNHFYEMKGDVGMSVHEKERKQEDAYTKTQTHS